jgi:predicted nucleic acid binding AN1-type Zn finger protein
MPPIDNDNVKCVGVGSTTTIGPQNLSSALPPKSKKNESTSTVWEHFTKLEEGDPNDPKSKCNYCGGLFSCHPRSHGTSCYNISGEVAKNFLVGLISPNQS